MTTSNNTDLQELKALVGELRGEFRDNLRDLKVDLKEDMAEIKGDFKALHVEIKSLDKRLSNVETLAGKIPEITEKFGELKNWRQTAFVIIAGVVSAFLGWIARGNNFN